MHDDQTITTLSELARELGRPERDWATLAEGNVSGRGTGGLVHVKASGAFMANATDDDIVTVALADLLRLIDDPDAGDAEVAALFDAAAASNGGRRPSVEALLHAVCLEVPGVEVVGHTHPVAVNSLLCSVQADLLVRGALFPDQIVVLGADPMLVPYVDPGLALARTVRSLLRERTRPPRVIYLRNHGMFALGATAADVVHITEMAVKVARVLVGARSTGTVEFMDPAEVARIDTRPDELLRRASLAATAVLTDASTGP
ncbi:class II aldolase/adducin family protein [Curtobacterium sp. BRB10]|uniref:class II aldolase/adducin family protein n=1 Tax=Curtobacterium sp. BRB10 TaxID=2962579 RepID=UPI00288283D7|nr:class II aldolase/adducin family protein [Curtobacterium sp. BRB10]MDT0234848.1 class II aldolase/adducin family protein [Curtobacterium sp. BRB10]